MERDRRRSLPILLHDCVDRVRVDVRDALRALRAGRWTTIVAFAILTATLAAGTVTFSVVDAVALRPLPYGDPERLVDVSLPGQTLGQRLPVSPAAYLSWVEGIPTLESLAAARHAPPLRVDIDGTVATLRASSVSASLFDVLGVRPAVGRFFGPEHERPGGPAGVILSYDTWVRRFHRDVGVIGRRLAVGPDTGEIVGVLPPHVTYPISTATPPDAYVPYVVTPAERAKTSMSLFVVGRLRPGVTVDQARADFGRLSSAMVIPLHDRVVGQAKSWLFLALAAIGVVLLVACINVATLLLARTTTRAAEFATREALGASRRRVTMGLLLEGLLLALASAAAAIVLSVWGVEIAKTSLPAWVTRVSTIAIDGRVMSVSITVAILCSLVFASAPAWLASRFDLVRIMNASGGPSIGGRRRNRTLSAFLVADIAFVCVLLVAATLVVTTFIVVTTADLGFDRQNVLIVEYERPLNAFAERDRSAVAATLRADLLTRVISVPGVTHASIMLGGSTPLSGGNTRYSVTIPGVVDDATREDMWETNMVTPDYFRVMGMQLIRGRLFEPSDRTGAPLVVLVTDMAARRFFPGRDPIGQVVIFREQPRTIVGVLRDLRHDGPEADVRPGIYTPLDQDPSMFREMTFGALVVRTTQDARRYGPAIRDAIRPALAGEPEQPRFVEDEFRRVTAVRRFNARLMSAFGLIAVAIGAIGVYGTIAFFVTQRVRAIACISRLVPLRPTSWPRCSATRSHAWRSVSASASPAHGQSPRRSNPSSSASEPRNRWCT